VLLAPHMQLSFVAEKHRHVVQVPGNVGTGFLNKCWTNQQCLAQSYLERAVHFGTVACHCATATLATVWGYFRG